MKRTILALLFAVCCRLTLAGETDLMLTVDGHTYSNITFGAVTPYAVSILHSSGIVSIPLAKLPPALQKELGYDPEKAARYQAAKLEAMQVEQARVKQRQAELQEQERVRKASSQETEGDENTKQKQATASSEGAQWRELRKQGKEPMIRQIGDSVYDFSKAVAWCLRGNYRGNGWQLTNPNWRSYLVKGWVIQVVEDGLLVDMYDQPGYTGSMSSHTVHLRHYPDQDAVVDRALINVIAIPCGRYRYTTTHGGVATVPDYDFGVPPVPASSNKPVVPLPPDAEK